MAIHEMAESSMQSANTHGRKVRPERKTSDPSKTPCYGNASLLSNPFSHAMRETENYVKASPHQV